VRISMTDTIQKLENMVSAGLADENNLTSAGIREFINNVRSSTIFADIGDEAAEMLARKIEERLDITMTVRREL